MTSAPASTIPAMTPAGSWAALSPLWIAPRVAPLSAPPSVGPVGVSRLPVPVPGGRGAVGCVGLAVEEVAPLVSVLPATASDDEGDTVTVVGDVTVVIAVLIARAFVVVAASSVGVLRLDGQDAKSHGSTSQQPLNPLDWQTYQELPTGQSRSSLGISCGICISFLVLVLVGSSFALVSSW